MQRTTRQFSSPSRGGGRCTFRTSMGNSEHWGGQAFVSGGAEGGGVVAGLQHRERLQPCTWNKAHTLRCTSFARPKGASGTTDEGLVLLSLRTCLPLRGTPLDPLRGVDTAPWLDPPPLPQKGSMDDPPESY